MKNKKMVKLSVALGLSCIALIGGISAYFTDGDTATNEFTIGKVSLKLEEPNWTPPKDITPNQEIEKDPQITNDGINDEFVFLEVQVPCYPFTEALDDGTIKDNSSKQSRTKFDSKELFTYTINEGWTEIVEPIYRFNERKMCHFYVYGSTDECAPLKKDSTTPPLFNSVILSNIIEDEGFEETTQEIIINAYGIQTENINGGKKAPLDVLSVIENQLST